MSVCAATGKIKYSKEEAKRENIRLKGQHGLPYRCDRCGCWHLGHNRDIDFRAFSPGKPRPRRKG